MTDAYGGFSAQAMLCDSAVAVEGKLYIHGGGWNAIAAATMPLTVPRIGIALILEVPYGQTDTQHQLSVGLEDEDGAQLPLGPMGESGRAPAISLSFSVGRPAMMPPGDSHALPFALNIDGYPLQRPGGYAFVVAVDGDEVTRLRFRVHLQPA